MTRAEVVAKLRREGFAATVGRVRQALLNGYVRPLPTKGARGAFRFTAHHLRQLRWYFVNVRPGPRPQWDEKFPMTGSADRVRRLAVKKQRLQGKGLLDRALRRQRQKDTDTAIEILEQIAQQLSRQPPSRETSRH